MKNQKNNILIQTHEKSEQERFYGSTQQVLGVQQKSGYGLEIMCNLSDEIKQLEELNVDVQSKLLISKKAHIILPTHKLLDQASEISKGKNKIGSTLKGIGPTYMDKTGRNGIRVGDLFQEGWESQYSKLRDKHLNIINNLIWL